MTTNDDNRRQSETVSVSDPDDFTTSARLKQIYQARRDVRESRREASQYRHGNHSHRTKVQAVQYYRTAVEGYLLEVDTLLTQHDPGPRLWHDKYYGTVTIQPPGRWEEKRTYYRSKNKELKPNVPLKVDSLPEPKEVDIIGLKWLFNAESPVTRDFEFEVRNPHYKPGPHADGGLRPTKTMTGSALIAWTQLNEMVTDINEFLAELGIGLSLDENNEWTI